ncbi:hypothetical protein WMY93_004599 [Mugilogobius chulae]|uniref:G-protein coupled receptors family 1 profile domain-containing protein n=1 Tax=Mugilogobius chulae TaxID=88201 RepID=A0AAW0Q0B7_9GOBI
MCRTVQQLSIATCTVLSCSSLHWRGQILSCGLSYKLSDLEESQNGHLCLCLNMAACFSGSGTSVSSKQTFHLPELDITTCHDVQDVQKLQSYYVTFSQFMHLFFFIPLGLTVVCYVRIVQNPQSSQRGDQIQKTRAVVMTILVLVMFIVCFAPTNVILMVHYVQLSHGSSDSTYQAYLLSLCVGSLNCCIDPLLYYFGSSQCQKQVLVMLKEEETSDIKYIQNTKYRSMGTTAASVKWKH